MDNVTREDFLRTAIKYQDALVSYAYGLLQDWASAQDAVQEAFIVLDKKWGTLRQADSIYPWMRQVVRHKSIDMIRSRSRETTVGDMELLDLMADQFDQHMDDRFVELMEKRKKILRLCMEKLRGKSLDMLMGFYRDRASCKELAAYYRNTVNAIRLRLSRTRQQLRQCVRRKMLVAEDTA